MAQLLMPGSVVAMTDQAADRLLKLDSSHIQYVLDLSLIHI